MLRFPHAVNISLATHSAVPGNYTPWTESVNQEDHLRYPRL
jgi:hypothetical protein